MVRRPIFFGRPGACPGQSGAMGCLVPQGHSLGRATFAAYVEALGGRLEIIADFGDQRLVFTEPGTEAA